MGSMDEKITDLDPDTANRLLETLASQKDRGFRWLSELDAKITNTNFLTNGGGAAATLAFIGTGVAPDGAIFGLFCFVIGIIATIIELRALQSYYAVLLKDALRRYSGFLNGELTVKECLVPKEIAQGQQTVNHVSGWVSQLAFSMGVIAGVYLFLCGAP